MVQAQEKQPRGLNDGAKKEIDAITAKHGVLTPLAILDYAKNPKTELNKFFTWDDGEAAHRWRLEQAKGLIRCYVTILPGKTETIRAYVSLSSDRQNTNQHTAHSAKGMGVYRPITEVLKNKDTRETLLRDAQRDLIAFSQKYRALRSMTDQKTQMMFAAIDNFLKSFTPKAP